jgi:glutamyl-Q tRNA(Asp) synthetase
MMTPQAATRGQEPFSPLSTLVVTRFAPSPTGRLHLGHAYSALRAHDHARSRGGAFLLRIEDIDPGRSRPEFVRFIMEDLQWLGLGWDGEIVFQSRRLPLYQAALDRLRATGLLYPCFCTRKQVEAEIAASASAPHGPDGPVYPGTCRDLPDPDLTRPHAWRLNMAAAVDYLRSCEGRSPAPQRSCLRRSTWSLAWTDGSRTIPADPARFGDIVLARKDAPASYHLAVTIDDAAQGVTDVVRGEDLFEATHIHRLLQALLGLPTPFYHHHKLLRGPDGARLAKRHGAPSLADLRASGADPADVTGALRAGRAPAGYSLAAP